MRDRVFFIAEAGVNHNGSVARALELVEVAARAGADAVKFQTFRAEELATRDVASCEYQEKNTEAKSQQKMLKDLELDFSAHARIADACKASGIAFLSTAFDVKSLNDLISKIGMDCIKIPSGELVNPLLLVAAARTGKPVFLSTGMAYLAEVEAALKLLAFGAVNAEKAPTERTIEAAYLSPQGQAYLKKNVTLLQCTTAYPAPVEAANLRAMQTMADAFDLKIGLSDHTRGFEVALAAVAMGGRVIEKHFTLDRALPGPDHMASLEPPELEALISSVRMVEAALGNPRKEPQPVEMENRNLVRRVLVAAKDIQAGEILSADSIALMRAGEGISAMEYWTWIGREAPRDFRKHECLSI